MSLIVKPKGAYKKNVNTQQGLFNQILITKNIPISINNIGNSIKETLEKAIAFQVEGKCIVEGYIKPNTVEIITFSSGLVNGSIVMFEVVFQCYVCSPVEGMHINCVAKHINKAGIRAEINESPSPVVIFIARDHNYTSPLFSQIKENDEIKVRVIGQRFELNDKYISIIAELLENPSHPANTTRPSNTNMATNSNANVSAAKLTIKSKPGKITATKKLSIAKEISTELAKEIAEEIEVAEITGLEPAAALTAPVTVEPTAALTAALEPATLAPALTAPATLAPVKKTTIKLKPKLKIKN
jgi:hypothetical protein